MILLKRRIIVILIIFFLGTSFYPALVSSKTTVTKNDQTEDIFFGLKSHVDLTWDENLTLEPIAPNIELFDLDLNISFWVTYGIFGGLVGVFLCGRPVQIKFEIDKPDWCSASLSSSIITISIPKKNVMRSIFISLVVHVNDSAPAFEEFPITIKATTDREIKGPFGLISFLSPATITKNITLRADYTGIISYYVQDSIETPPQIEKQLPVIAENMANGKTIIECEIIESLPDFVVYFDPEELVLEVGEEKTTYLNITAPVDFSGEGMIMVCFTPHYFYNYSIVGASFNHTIKVFYYP